MDTVMFDGYNDMSGKQGAACGFFVYYCKAFWQRLERALELVSRGETGVGWGRKERELDSSAMLVAGLAGLAGLIC